MNSHSGHASTRRVIYLSIDDWLGAARAPDRNSTSMEKQWRRPGRPGSARQWRHIDGEVAASTEKQHHSRSSGQCAAAATPPWLRLHATGMRPLIIRRALGTRTYAMHTLYSSACPFCHGGMPSEQNRVQNQGGGLNGLAKLGCWIHGFILQRVK
jgi:hypothetical protein